MPENTIEVGSRVVSRIDRTCSGTVVEILPPVKGGTLVTFIDDEGIRHDEFSDMLMIENQC